jgi:hypothetical protein
MVKIYNKLTNFRAMKYANLPRSASEKGGVPPEMGANQSRKRGELGRRWRLPEMGEIGRKWVKIGAGNGMRRRYGPVCAGTAGLCWVREIERAGWVGRRETQSIWAASEIWCRSVTELGVGNGGKSDRRKRGRSAD